MAVICCCCHCSCATSEDEEGSNIAQRLEFVAQDVALTSLPRLRDGVHGPLLRQCHVVGVLQALHVILGLPVFFVEGHFPDVGARGRNALAVPDQVLLQARRDIQVLQALLHELILAPVVPLQVLAAGLAAAGVGLHGHPREHLHGAEELGRSPPAAVRQEELRLRRLGAVGEPEVRLQPAGEEDDVGVDLDGPVVFGPPVVGYDASPGRDEEPLIGAGVAVHVGLEVALECPGLDGRRDHHGTVAVEREFVAPEDAGLVPALPLYELCLMARGHDEGKAEERPAGRGRLVDGRRRPEHRPHGRQSRGRAALD
mmetsp:Transcript_22133/g.63839  ORF Transcript_22133/g.63839 Transcript_22133/m.63839 type:complete len:313 (+) Transcript_22133:53-991(+)